LNGFTEERTLGKGESESGWPSPGKSSSARTEPYGQETGRREVPALKSTFTGTCKCLLLPAGTVGIPFSFILPPAYAWRLFPENLTYPVILLRNCPGITCAI